MHAGSLRAGVRVRTIKWETSPVSGGKCCSFDEIAAPEALRPNRLRPAAACRNTGRVAAAATFEELLAEGDAVPVEGWDFSWFDGRATEERPSWGYSRLLAERMAGAAAALDVQTGGGEVLAQIPHPPPVLAATESWPPNIEIARRNLAPLGA
jgi:hypothetical protein